jgi:zinc protease
MRCRSSLAARGWVFAAALALQAGGAIAAEPSIAFKATTSPGGIPFHFRSDPRTPFAAINFGMRDVYALTTQGKAGLLSLGGAMVMQGADGAGQTELIERLRDYAASASYSFGAFSSQGQVRAPAATLGKAVDLMAATLNGSRPTEKVLVRLKAQAKGAEAQAGIRAETIAQRAALRLALGDHPFVRSLDPARFDMVMPDDIAQWRQRMLDRDKLRIAASGRLGEAEAGALVDRAFAGLPGRLDPLDYTWPRIEVPASTVVVEHDTQQSAIVIVGMTSIATGLEAETGSIANAVLGGSNGRLWRAVREALGSTYGASSGFQAVGSGQRLIRLSGAVANDQVKASLDAIRQAYASWQGKGISAGELKAAKARAINSFRSAFDDPSRANGVVLGMLLANRQVDQLAGYEARVGALTPERVNAFIADNLPSVDRLLTVIVTPKAEGLGADCVIDTLARIESCRR